jgi:Tfp pilus assembly protein PilF
MTVLRLILAATLTAAALVAPGVAYAACESAVTMASPNRVRANEAVITTILNDANGALARGDAGEACVKYRLVLGVDAANVEARLGLGEGALLESNSDAARAHFQAVTQAAPDNARAYQGVGLSYLVAGDFTAAEAPLRRSVELDQALWRSWNGLGMIADGRGAWDDSDLAWNAALAAAPNQADIHNNRGLSLMQRGQPANAVRAFEDAMRINPSLSTASNNRRIALATLGLYDTALTGVSDRDLPATLNNVAVVAARRGDRAIAERLLAAAITASPRYYELAVRNQEAIGGAAR